MVKPLYRMIEDSVDSDNYSVTYTCCQIYILNEVQTKLYKAPDNWLMIKQQLMINTKMWGPIGFERPNEIWDA